MCVCVWQCVFLSRCRFLSALKICLSVTGLHARKQRNKKICIFVSSSFFCKSYQVLVREVIWLAFIFARFWFLAEIISSMDFRIGYCFVYVNLLCLCEGVTEHKFDKLKNIKGMSINNVVDDRPSYKSHITLTERQYDESKWHTSKKNFGLIAYSDMNFRCVQAFDCWKGKTVSQLQWYTHRTFL